MAEILNGVEQEFFSHEAAITALMEALAEEGWADHRQTQPISRHIKVDQVGAKVQALERIEEVFKRAGLTLKIPTSVIPQDQIDDYELAEFSLEPTSYPQNLRLLVTLTGLWPKALEQLWTSIPAQYGLTVEVIKVTNAIVPDLNIMGYQITYQEKPLLLLPKTDPRVLSSSTLPVRNEETPIEPLTALDLGCLSLGFSELQARLEEDNTLQVVVGSGKSVTSSLFKTEDHIVKPKVKTGFFPWQIVYLSTSHRFVQIKPYSM